MNDLPKKIETVANIAIIFVAILLGIVAVRHHLNRDGQLPSTQSVDDNANYKPAVGTTLSLSGVDWGRQNKTLILALSTSCHFCSESAPFYRRLAKEAKQTHLMAVLPQTVDEGREYLRRLGISIDDVNQTPLSVLGVQGTPTLMLVNHDGTIIGKWVGRLVPEQEAEVLTNLKAAKDGK